MKEEYCYTVCVYGEFYWACYVVLAEREGKRVAFV
jgi:hypothetical protein